MPRRFVALAISTSLVLAGLALPASAAALEPPGSMAATGDSITRAFNLCIFPFSDCPAQSWSTGTNTTVNSHARRLQITSSAHNDAVSGAKMADLPGQARTVAGRNVDYVTVLMGGNDVCTDTETGMTSPSVYSAAFVQAMENLEADPDGSPPLVYVVSVPNVKVLWEILKDDSSARGAWSRYNICQSLLANPLSMDRADVDRRERVKQRNMELNQALRTACAAYTFCRFDGERVFGTRFVPTDVSTRDYFHPSTAGQKKLAEVSWNHGPYVTSAVNGAPTADFTFSCSGLTCSFADASTDPNGVNGWSWNFDATGTAGATSVRSDPTHTFAAAGTYTVKLFAIDQFGATSSTSRVLTVSVDGGEPAPNSPPTASFTHNCSGLTCSFTDTSTDSDGSIASRSWRFGDGGSSTATNPTHSYSSDGTYTVSLTVTDDDDASTSTSEPVIVTAPTPMWVGGLTSSTSTARNIWTATVTITVVDASGGLSGVAVSGSWSAGSGSGSCTTGSGGTCMVSVTVNKKTTSTTYSVTNLATSGWVYQQPAGTSTSITVTKP